jgi:hypothetical protein
MAETKGGLLAIVAFAMVLYVTPARADEGHSYSGDGGFVTEFYLIGGQYQLYTYAKLGPAAIRLHHSCIFGGHFSRLLPDQETTRMGPVTIATTLVPYRINLNSVAMPAGLYRLYIASSTDCRWNFDVISTQENSSGVASVQMVKMNGTDRHLTATASLADTMEFSADFRTDHNAVEQVSGTMQILHDGEIVRDGPLQFGTAVPLRGNFFYGNVQWSPADAKYLGANTVKFMVKIGPKEFTTTGEFTLTQ